VSLSRRRLLQLAVGSSLAVAAALLPGTALQAEAPPPALPDSVQQALQDLASLGFEDVVAIYNDLRPTIEIQPVEVLTAGGMTLGWATTPRRFSSIQLRADLQDSSPVFMAILAHELLHVWQFAYDSAIYENCVAREVPAYRLEASVMRAWCTAHPSLRYGLSADCMRLLSVAEKDYPETLDAFAAKASCGMR
jgi:hypothetical protein